MMKRFLLVIAAIFLTFSTVLSTEQFPDILIIGKDTIYLKSFPLEQLRAKNKFIKTPFDYGSYSFPSTGCYRGYVATWQIIDEFLTLKEVRKIDSDLSHYFYVCLNDTAYALTVVKGVELFRNVLQFDNYSKNEDINFWYDQNENNEYLKLLRSQYPIDSLIKGSLTDMDKALKILNWVHRQWLHNGSNEPSKNDAISILEEAKEGKNFRCVEYGIVTAACLNAIGLHSRLLSLTKY